MHCDVLVSIITVCYNSEKTIARTIEAVLNQTYPTIQYIIIDGNSADRTVSIAKEYSNRFYERDISYHIYSEPDNGIYDAMNKGIDLASGELIGIINSDDWYEEDAVRMVVEHYLKTHFDLVFGDISMVGKNGKSFIKHAKKSRYITSRYWNHPTQFVSREVYHHFKYQCETISDDMDFYFKVIKAGYQIEVIHMVLASFRMGGVSSRISIGEVIPRIKRRYKIYRNNGFSRFYLAECVLFEIIKFMAVQ